MEPNKTAKRYILVSAVKDEEQYVETTLRAVVKQTVRPGRWMIVDDGSTDRTTEIIRSYERQFPWITVLRLNHQGARQPGSPVINAFNAGYELIRNSSFDFIVKFDCDLDLPADYFEKLIDRFQSDERLGIASGVYLEHGSKNWQPIPMPDYHAAGAAKMIRARCFNEIGGFVASRGWDTVDEIKAQAMGWRTGHFEDLEFHHLKNEGSGIGSIRTNRMHGEVYYLTGGSKLFFLFKIVHRCAVGKPPLLGGLAMLGGYLKTWAKREPRLVTEEEARAYQRLLDHRMLETILRRFNLSSWKRRNWRFS
jgi:poly-beta-1,6-N-acetyl-D-glucosamine synthase